MRGRPRHVLASGSGLVHRLGADRDAGNQRPEYGDQQPAAGRHGDPLGSRRAASTPSAEFARFCRRNQMRTSVGRTGVCRDNAAAESFFATLKRDVPPTALRHPRPCEVRRRRIHRNLLQPATAALSAGLPHSSRSPHRLSNPHSRLTTTREDLSKILDTAHGLKECGQASLAVSCGGTAAPVTTRDPLILPGVMVAGLGVHPGLGSKLGAAVGVPGRTDDEIRGHQPGFGGVQPDPT